MDTQASTPESEASGPTLSSTHTRKPRRKEACTQLCRQPDSPGLTGPHQAPQPPGGWDRARGKGVLPQARGSPPQGTPQLRGLGTPQTEGPVPVPAGEVEEGLPRHPRALHTLASRPGKSQAPRKRLLTGAPGQEAGNEAHGP